jgi:two-component system response regulator MtrA
MLEKAGFRVVTAANGREAVRQLREHAVHVVVTDILMPEMDGIELIRTIVADGLMLPIIATSGADDWDAYLGMAAQLGAKATLRKPVDAAELVAKIEELLAADLPPPGLATEKTPTPGLNSGLGGPIPALRG